MELGQTINPRGRFSSGTVPYTLCFRATQQLNPFIGLTAITLAIIGVFLAWSSAYVRLFTYIGIGALLFSLGGASVFHGIIYSLVPWVEKARSPAMAILGFHLAVAVLASFGVDELVGAHQLPATLSRLITWGPLAFGITLYVML